MMVDGLGKGTECLVRFGNVWDYYYHSLLCVDRDAGAAGLLMEGSAAGRESSRPAE